MKLRLGTRGSALAVAQSGHVAEALCQLHPQLSIELVAIKTTGDKITDVALSKIGDRGLFVKELEEALLDGFVDFAVHSMKDMPTALPDGLSIACVPVRRSPLDCLVSLQHTSLDALPVGARVGTGSLRRRAQLRAFRPDLQFVEIRGNLSTRIRKLSSEGLDATVLAVAGLERLGVTVGGRALVEDAGLEVWLSPIPSDVCLPAVGQGALCLEARDDRPDVLEILAALDDPDSHTAVLCERALMRRLQGGCQVPIAGWARVSDGDLLLDAALAALDGSKMIRVSRRGGIPIGVQAAEDILAQGGDVILEEIRRAQ
jgi:hydroxymethylbilane synthase